MQAESESESLDQSGWAISYLTERIGRQTDFGQLSTNYAELPLTTSTLRNCPHQSQPQVETLAAGGLLLRRVSLSCCLDWKACNFDKLKPTGHAHCPPSNQGSH
ncbi:hypothetical protein ACLKA6_003361 [Drosophila palustris]